MSEHVKSIYANFKCNHTRSSFEQYLKEYKAVQGSSKHDICLFLPAAIFAPNDPVKWGLHFGAQNIYPAKSGAFTGEIGLIHLDDYAINRVLLGHSERRALGESKELLRQKFDFCKAEGLKITFCIGEDSGEDFKSVVQAQLEGIDLNYAHLNIAYEPVFAIGKSAISAEELEPKAQFLRSLGVKRLLYGGSVNASNAASFAGRLQDSCEANTAKDEAICDGLLIGGAALSAKGLFDIVSSL